MAGRLETISGIEISPGASLPSVEQTYTRDIWAASEDAIAVAADDPTHRYRSETNIHSDASVATSEGLPGRIAPGAVLVNWVSRLMVEQFGMGYIAGGGLQLRFIAPMFEGQRVRIDATVKSVIAVDRGGHRVALDISAATDRDTLCALGTAEAEVAGP